MAKSKYTRTVEITPAAHEFIKSNRGSGKLSDVVDRLVELGKKYWR